MRILVVGNFSDRRCGFQNFSLQTVTALRRAKHEVFSFDGTYSQVYARQQDPNFTFPQSFLPAAAADLDVIHVIWHPATLNHYSGATWPEGPVLSVWNGCPAASCPFTDRMDVRWGVLGKEQPPHRQLWYPIPDWVTDLPPAAPEFTVGYSGVRREGLGTLEAICRARGWVLNASDPEVWLSQEDEIRRLARSTVNVCWYGYAHDDRSGSAMVCLASRRPLLTNTAPMFTQLAPYAHEHYRAIGGEGREVLESALETIYREWFDYEEGMRYPRQVLTDLSWTAAVAELEKGWVR